MYAYFREIGRQTPVDVTLYNIPMFASPIDVPTVQRLSEECPRIVALKDSSGDIAHMQRMIAAVRPNRPEFSFLCGWDVSIMPMMLMGCDGGTNAVAGVAPELMRALYDLTAAGRLDEARLKQNQVAKLFDPMVLGLEFPEWVRAAVKLRGIKLGDGRMPISEETKSQVAEATQRVEQELHALGLL